MQINKRNFFGIIIIIIALIALVFCSIYERNHTDSNLSSASKIIIEAQETNENKNISQDIMDELQKNIEQRIELQKFSKITVKQIGKRQLEVILPSDINVESFIKSINTTSKLEFKKPILNNGNVIGYTSSGLTEKDIKKVKKFLDNGGYWRFSLKFNDSGSKKLAELTKEFKGYPISIYLNNELILEPIIQSEITGGVIEITGYFSDKQIDEMNYILNIKEYPVPIKIVE